MQMFTTDWLTTIFNNFEGNPKTALSIQEVNIDSRKKTKDSLFIPIIGEKFDGHEFVLQAIDNGAVAVIWNSERQLPPDLPKDFPVFLVDDTVEALQLLSIKYRDVVNPTVIGITGSNGKKTTKDIVATIHNQNYNTHLKLY